MSKTWQYVFAFSLFLILVMLPQDITAAKQRIFDYANLLSDDEINSLEQQAKKHSEKRNTDFIVITITEETASDVEQFMEDFYDNEKPGFDKPKGNAAILGIDIDRRDVVLHGYGLAEKRLDGHRLELIRSNIRDDLSEGNYYDAFEQFIALGSDYIRFKEGVNPDNIFYNTLGQLGIAIVLSGLIVGFMVYQVNPKSTTTPSTYRDDTRSRVINQYDRYIRKTVTRRRRQKDNTKGGGGSGPPVGRTSGGSSYSRSRGKF